MKDRNLQVAFIFAFLILTGHAITIQNEPSSLANAGRTVVVAAPQPKYTLNEAIDVCINELEQRGETVTAGAVKNRLQRMPKSDVDLNVKGLSRTIREVIDAREAAEKAVLPAPEPEKYETREKFIAAYVKWKTDGLTNAERGAQHAVLGGESKFRRETRAEADKIWQESKNKGDKK